MPGWLPDVLSADALANPTVPDFLSRNLVYNGATWDRVRSADLGSIKALPRPQTPIKATSAPAVNVQATAGQAAGGAGIKNVCNVIAFSAFGGVVAPAAVALTVNLRDGVSGAGTILWSMTVVLGTGVGAGVAFSESGFWIEGTANTAMTLEFAAAGGANTFESVALVGCQVS